MTTLLKSATIINTTSSFHKQQKDILIEKGVITQIKDSITPPENTNIIQLENLHISTGWFDTSVCFGEPGFEERETINNGLQVAQKSGFTAVAVNPNTQPITDTKATVEFIKNKAFNSATDLYPIGALTQKSEGIEMAELYDMQQSGAIAFGDYKKPISNDNLLKIALLYAQNFNGLVLSFPKNKQIAGDGIAHEGANATRLGLKGIPALAEEMQVARDLFLLEYTGGKLHIPTISTKKSAALIKEAKDKGLDVSCSVAVHNLVLTDSELEGFDARTKVNPPLRTKEDVDALISAVKEGVVDMITSDHNPIDIEDKKVEFAIAKDGTIGLETTFLALNKILPLDNIIENLTDKPRVRFGLETVTIEENTQANLTLFTPTGENTFTEAAISSTSKNSIFLNKKLKGKVYGIINNNQVVIN